MFFYANKRNWYKYFCPTWMNRITYEYNKKKGYPTSKIWRWLILGWTTK